MQYDSFSMHQFNPTTDFELASGFGLLLRADQDSHAGSQRGRNFRNGQRGATFFAAHLARGRSVHGQLSNGFSEDGQGGHN